MRMIAAVFLAALALSGEAFAKEGTHAAACQAEANAGYARAWRLEPSLRPAIADHRARMSAACARVAAEKAAALNACLAEAARGPRHVQRGRNADRDHIVRQKTLCRQLAS